MSANLPADISSPVVFARHLAQHGFDLSCNTNVQVPLPKNFVIPLPSFQDSYLKMYLMLLLWEEIM